MLWATVIAELSPTSKQVLSGTYVHLLKSQNIHNIPVPNLEVSYLRLFIYTSVIDTHAEIWQSQTKSYRGVDLRAEGGTRGIPGGRD